MLQNGFLLPGGGRGGRGGRAARRRGHRHRVARARREAEGRLVRIDDFIVTLTLADGTQRTFRRDGDTPKVELHDPLAKHRELVGKYTDNDIHNLTAYLVTVK